MSQFILIEQSLCNVGGHHFEYAVEVLKAAEAEGSEPILAVNRDFKQLDRLPKNWRVVPVFPFRGDRIHRVPKNTSLRISRLLFQSEGSFRDRISATFEGVADRFKSRVSEYRWRRQRCRIRGFADACHRLFEAIQLEQGDYVFCSTVSDMDLLGLVDYLKGHRESTVADWHLQFHFGVFTGRDPDYTRQLGSVRRLRQRLETAIGALPNHRMSFYTTTDELRRQFNRLGAAEFQTLPWPVSPRFWQTRRRMDCQSVQTDADGLAVRRTDSLRMVCAGGLRREKGGSLLGPLVRALDDEFLKPRKVQLLIQADKKRRSRRLLGLRQNVLAEVEKFSLEDLPQSSVVALPHPLPPNDYADLINTADIGLLLYESGEYFARCSGILVEMLAAGVPVIGPAGCWLGNQIEQANREYLKQVLKHSVSVADWSLEKLATVVGRKEHIRDVSELALEADGADLFVHLAPSPAAGCGKFARVTLKQFAGDGSTTGELSTIVQANAERDVKDSTISTLFPIHAGTSRVRLTTENAYGAGPPPVRQLAAFLINEPDAARKHQPMGRIGLTASSPTFIPQLLQDLVENYDHYRASAAEFSSQWQLQHAPARTIEKLTGAMKTSREAVLRHAS